MQELELPSNIRCMQRLPFNAKFLLQGQGAVYVNSSSPPPDPFGSEALAFCSSFTTTSTPTPAQLPPGDERRLAKAPHPTHILKCPRCASLDTKFCYYNNYSLAQPRYFCKKCQRYWTAGGALRNVPVGGGLRKNKRSKLKLAAEAEVAAVAACDSAGNKLPVQKQHYEVNPPFPEVPSSGAMGSCITSTSSVVSAANLAGVLPSPSFRSSSTSHLIRTSSGSDNCSGSTVVEYAGNDDCSGVVAAAFLLDQQQNSNQLQHFFGDVCTQAAPRQFYSRYAANIPPSNHPYAGSPSEQLGASYQQAVCYGNQPCSAEARESNPGHANIYNNGSVACNAMANVGCEGGDLSSNERGEAKEDITISTNPTYDWQMISESLFNGAGTEGFLPFPGGSWPDFSQFHDPSGPG